MILDVSRQGRKSSSQEEGGFPKKDGGKGLLNAGRFLDPALEKNDAGNAQGITNKEVAAMREKVLALSLFLLALAWKTPEVLGGD